jgi:hypothetical protein
VPQVHVGVVVKGVEWSKVLFDDDRTKVDQFGIGMVPGRKRPVLYEIVKPPEGGAVIKVRAYFRSEEDAEATIKLLEKWIHARKED